MIPGPSADGGRGAPPTFAGAVGGAAAALLVLAPWLRPGELLVRDLVAVRDPAWSTSLLGAAEGLPRDVPGEAVAALVGQVVGGHVVVRLALFAALVALGAGVGRLLHGRTPAAVALAGAFAVWNPWVLGRLHQGQWLVVVALATLPWVVGYLAADDRWGVARSVAVAGVAGVLAVPVLAPTLAVVAVVARRWMALAVGGVTLVLVSLPWLLVTPAVVVDQDAFRAFAPNADLALGTAASLLTGGGYFNAAVASPWRSRPEVTAVALVLTAAALWGAWRWARRGRAERGLAVAAIVTVLVAAMHGTAVGRRLLADAAEVLPALTVGRDSHRLLGPLVVLLAVGVGVVVDRAARHRDVPRAAAVAVAGLLVVVALPDPVLGPYLPPPTSVPAAWHRAAAAIAAEPPAAVLVVPHGSTQRYPFTGGRPVAVPLGRLVGVPVLTDSRLVVDGEDDPIEVDDRAGGGVARSLAEQWPDVEGTGLGAAGVGWVAVTDPALVPPSPPAGTEVAVASPDLTLLRVTAPAEAGGGAPSTPVLVVDALVALVVLALLVASPRGTRQPLRSDGTRADRARAE